MKVRLGEIDTEERERGRRSMRKVKEKWDEEFPELQDKFTNIER